MTATGSPRTGEAERALERECATFAAYLTDRSPTEYVRRWYAAAHQGPEGEGLSREPVDPLDERILAMGRRGGVLLRMADVYARFFRPTALLRRKLVLMLALLENAPPTHRMVNTPRTGTRAGVLIRSSSRVGISGLLLVAGVLVFGVAHWRSRGRHDPGTAA